MTLDAIRLAAEERYRVPCLITHLDIVDTGTAAHVSLLPDGGEHIAFTRGRQKIDAAPRCHGREIVAVAGKRECAVREGEYESSVADGMAVEHVRAYGHGELGVTWPDARDAHAHCLRCPVEREHLFRDALSQRLRFVGSERRMVLGHGAYFPVKRA